jgi:NedA-like, galactose-binding domain/Vacuolar protein sorting-associated protein 62
MPFTRTFRLPWLIGLAGAALLGACSPESPIGDEHLDDGPGASTQAALFTPPNIALGKPTMQSSNYPGGGGAAALAVDGITNGNWGAGSVTHTNNESQPWWQVDLQGLANISTVVLHNRTDCCADRLQNFRVRVSSDGFNWQDFPYAGVAPTQSTFNINRSARYVRVQLDGTNPLSLAEVQVFASETPGSGGANIGNTVYGHWSGSGGRSASHPSNRQFFVDVYGMNEPVSFLLSSSANAYLYLLDGNGNVIAEDDNGGGGTHARISRVLQAGTYKLVAATATAGQSAEFTLAADRAVLRYPQRLRVQAATYFNWVYDDYKTGANDDVSVWRADLSRYPGYYSLGDVAMPSHGEAPRMTFVVSGEGDLLARPVDYNWVWSDWGSGGEHDVSFWDPVPPSGYTCLGTVTVLGYDKPSTDLIRCVRSEYVLPANPAYVWDDAGSGADNDVSLSQAEPRDYRGLGLSTFKGQNYHGTPNASRFWVLNKSATANPELMGLPVDAQTALQFAPRVWLHGEEYYFPSSVEHFLANVHVEGNNLVTNQPLGCDSCTDPVFLDGQRPDQVPVPMYVELVQRTQNGLPTNITDIIYWTFYPYNNGKRVCIGWYSPWGCVGAYSTFGNHVGDWEHMTVRFVDGRPEVVYLSQHSGGETFLYGSKWLTLVDTSHPEAYSAMGSHGLYRDAARHIYQNLPNGDFLADDTGRGIARNGWVRPVVFPWQPTGTYAGSLSWLNITADWGNPEGGCGLSEPVSGQCVRNGGPTAPMLKGFSQPPALTLE